MEIVQTVVIENNPTVSKSSQRWDKVKKSILPIKKNTRKNQSDRYTETQRNRTLFHPTLQQPSFEHEAFFLSKQQQSVQNAKESDDNLKERLSAVLQNASPTSSLSFSESSENIENKISIQPDLYCSFIKEEGDENDDDKIIYSNQVSKPQTKVSQNSTHEQCTSSSSSELESHTPSHRFVVCADPQLGMTTLNRDWVAEIEYCKAAVKKINSLQPRPKFACVCGDLIDMEESFYNNNPNALAQWDKDYCDQVKEQQVQDFKDIFNEMHPDIALICVCGNHDIGNRPTPETISRFRKDFGDEYLAFWANGTYNIILNNVLFNNPDGAMDIFEDQLKWLEDRLQYANKFRAAQIFVYAHHPWFLYHEEEEDADLKGGIPMPSEWVEKNDKLKNVVMSDAYFSVPKIQRKIALDLFRQYNVTACFCGHFHQNVVKKTSWGMDMIVTGPISMTLESTSNKDSTETGRGIRIVDVTLDGERNVGGGYFSHRFENF